MDHVGVEPLYKNASLVCFVTLHSPKKNPDVLAGFYREKIMSFNNILYY